MRYFRFYERYKGVLIFCLAMSLPCLLLSQQTSGGWVQQYGSVGHDQSGGVTLNSHYKLYSGVSFEENISLLINGKQTTIKKNGKNDILITCSDTLGNILSYCQLSGPGMKILRDFYQAKDNFIITGTFIKQLDFINRSGKRTLLSIGHRIGHFAVCIDTLLNIKWSKRLSLDYKCSILEHYIHNDSIDVIIAKRSKDAYPIRRDTNNYSPITLSYVKIVKNGQSNVVKLKDHQEASITHILPYFDKQILVGYFTDTLKVNVTTALISQGGKDIFLILCNNRGQILKAISFGGISDDVPNDIKLYNNEVDLLATFSDNLKIDTARTLFSFGSTDVALLKINLLTFSITYLQYGGSGPDFGEKIAWCDSSLLTCMKLAGKELTFSNNGVVISKQDSLLRNNIQSTFIVNDSATKLFQLCRGMNNKIKEFLVDDINSIYVSGDDLYFLQFGSQKIKAKGVQDAFTLKVFNTFKKKKPPLPLVHISDSTWKKIQDSLLTKRNSMKDSLFTLYPNPFQNNLTASYQGRRIDHVSIDLYDIESKLVFSQVILANNQNNAEISFTNSSLTPGTYLCKIIVSFTEGQDEYFVKQLLRKL